MSDPAKPHYNLLFETLVNIDEPGTTFQGMVAYCLYKRAKREWTSEFFQDHGRPPNDDELTAYLRTWTASRIGGVRKEADAVIGDFVGSVLESNAPRIREDALRGTFWSAVGRSMFAALLYTLLLIAALVVAQVAGVDIVSIVSGLKG